MPFARRATDADLPLIQPWDEWHAASPRRMAAGEVYIAGGDDNQPRAIAILDRTFFGRAWIAVLFVAAEHRRAGWGNLMLDHVEHFCGEKRIWTSTELPNLPMQSLLKKRGYQLTGVVENLQKNPELFYFKDLERA